MAYSRFRVPATRMEENWKKIKGYEVYEVSDLGRVRSLRKEKPMIMKQSDHYKAHRYIYLSNLGQRKKFFVHRLVADTFIPNPECKKVVNHKDMDKKNNTVANLEWVSGVENTRHYHEMRNSLMEWYKENEKKILMCLVFSKPFMRKFQEMHGKKITFKR